MEAVEGGTCVTVVVEGVGRIQVMVMLRGEARVKQRTDSDVFKFQQS